MTYTPAFQQKIDMYAKESPESLQKKIDLFDLVDDMRKDTYLTRNILPTNFTFRSGFYNDQYLGYQFLTRTEYREFSAVYVALSEQQK